MTNEAKVDGKKVWYLGNNRAKNLKIVQPSWDAPFFLTDNFSYAEDYSDYGVWKVILNDSVKNQLLDFAKDSDCKKLRWSPELINLIRSGEHDLNSIAYDLYMISRHQIDHLYVINKHSVGCWIDTASQFAEKTRTRKSRAKAHSHWADEPDYDFLLEMWRDIAEAGFAGFTHSEFNNKIIALYKIDAIDKISAEPVKHA